MRADDGRRPLRRLSPRRSRRARWQANATIVASKTTLTGIRQFDTYGGASLWVLLGDGTPSRLLDYATRQWSSMSDAMTTSGATILTVGDFRQFAIIKRIGKSVELVPHVFGTARHYRSARAGLYAYWRNSSVVLAAEAFRSLVLR